MTEHKSELLLQNYKSLFSAFKSFENSILMENKKFTVITQNFLRFSEILINIFFRIVESGFYGNFSENEEVCVNRMIDKKIVNQSKDWEIFLLFKNQLQNPDNIDDVELICEALCSVILDFSNNIMLSIETYLDKEILTKKTD